jgi:multisubunit Na+/H+ antiporter MnhC subunit
MEHDGKALAADEIDALHRHIPGVASVHVRAAITWLAIFPMVAIGMSVMSLFANSWHPVLRALVLTAFVVPLAVYQFVPRLLLLRVRLLTTLASRRSRSGRGVVGEPTP